MSQVERQNLDCEQFDEDDLDDEPDDLEEAMSNCSGFFDGEYFVCAAAGSEDCDWDCPFSRDLGLTARQIEERDEKEEEVSTP